MYVCLSLSIYIYIYIYIHIYIYKYIYGEHRREASVAQGRKHLK